MAIFTVTSLTDATSGADYQGSLRQALDQAAQTAGADTIVFDESLKDGVITINSALRINDGAGVTIRGDIDGPGEVNITISGDVNDSGRFNSTLYGGTDDARRIDDVDSSFLFNVAGSKATFIGVEFDGGRYISPTTDAYQEAGGVIVNSGDLSLIDSTIDGAKVTSTNENAQGLAVVVNRAGGTMTLRDVLFDDAYVKSARAIRTDDPTANLNGGRASLIHNSGDLEAERLTTAGRFYGGPGVAVSDISGDLVTDGGDAAMGIFNAGTMLNEDTIIVRTGPLAVAGGARGRIIDVTSPFDPPIYGEYGSFNNTNPVINISDGSFGGLDSGSFTFATNEDDTFDGPSTNAGRDEPVAYIGIGGDDMFIGTEFGDYAHGGTGNDTLLAGIGDDTLGGGHGNDSVDGRNGFDVIDGGTGNDTLSGGRNFDTIDGGDGHDEIMGGSGSDVLSGGNGEDSLFGGVGTDDLRGGKQDDLLEGGNASDNLSGQDGKDTLKGGNGNDTLRGGGSNDELFGGKQNDFLNGGNASDSLSGQNGADTLLGENGADTLVGGGGKDDLRGGNQNDLLAGGAGTDKLSGDNGNDTLIGSFGNDTLIGGSGDDFLNGGDGTDVFVFTENGGDDRILDFTVGFDRMLFDVPGLGFADLRINDNVSGNAVIDYGEGTVEMIGVSSGQLRSDDFEF